MFVNVTKIFQKMKNRNLLSIEKVLHNEKKYFNYHYEEVFQFRIFCFFIRESIRNFFLLHLYLKSCLSKNKKMKRNIKKFGRSGFASFLLKSKKFFKLRVLKEQSFRFFSEGAHLKIYFLREKF